MKEKTKNRLKVAGAFLVGVGGMYFVAAKMKAKSDKSVDDMQFWADQQNYELNRKMRDFIDPTIFAQLRDKHVAEVQADYAAKFPGIASRHVIA